MPVAQEQFVVERDRRLPDQAVDVDVGDIHAAEGGAGAEREVRGTACLLVFEDAPADPGVGVGFDAELGDKATYPASEPSKTMRPSASVSSGAMYASPAGRLPNDPVR